ncbi:putative solute carrier family 13 [Helianthus annuus]|uniref:Putative sodium/sulfate symporter n=1 Tax=Helianthus annuus TaxID=4232 RepID=A0A251RQH1_HELAN|nr:putative solute carrier family 13 [Helianthus annuus]KAJ0429249.1 putative solute carrier family 13 [Helianthus annuus]KAJ0667460.1 putative solute carrier family 13 [Helianthus annuus]KAJ0799102.1 putative solute carrier family 13 [Helianthus annuus]KAJ0813271.1 putative solute carrier family 13 [Helianthus annuus]
MMGLYILLILGMLSWMTALIKKLAWDTLTWFAVFLGMRYQLMLLGVIPWVYGTFILRSVYFFIDYLFAGQTTHIGALYQAILPMHIKANVLKTLYGLLLVYNTNLFGALTHYRHGQALIH